jgi:hypothetical protein
MKKLKNLLWLLICIGLFSCNSIQWEEVTTIGSIKQGNLFKLEPLKDTVLILSGSEFSITNIDFKCISLQNNEGIKYKSAVSLPSSSSTGLSSFETISGKEFEFWPKDSKEQKIRIPITILPTMQKYEGKGQVYLYLVDSTEMCISNIIAWKIKFK